MTDKSNKPLTTATITSQLLVPQPIPTREEFHRSFAGVIYEYDFDTSGEHSIKDMATRIKAANNFDNQCRINDDIRKRRSTYEKEL